MRGEWSPQGSTGTYCRERKERDGKDGEARGYGLPDPGLRHLVPVADGGDRHLMGQMSLKEEPLHEDPTQQPGTTQDHPKTLQETPRPHKQQSIWSRKLPGAGPPGAG